MNLRDLLGGMRRRWYVVLAGLVVTGVLCLGAMHAVPVKYTAQSTVLLLPPNSTVGTGGNPYLSLNGLQSAVDVLGRAMMSEQNVSDLTNGSKTDSYTLEADTTTSGPLLVVSVTSSSADGAMALMQAVLDRAPTVLHDMQTRVNAPDETLISLSVIAEDSTATSDQKSQIRALIVALAGGLAITVLASIMIDAALRRRSARKRAGSEDALLPAASAPSQNGRPEAPQSRSSDAPPNGRPLPLTAPASRPRSGLRAPTRPASDRVK